MANNKNITFDQLHSSMIKVKNELNKKANNSHGTHVNYYDDNPKVAGTLTAGSSSKVSRGDHVHPAQTTITGNAGTATTLATARTLTIGNTGKTFNGSANVSWNLNEIGAIPLTGSTAISGNLEFAQSNTTTRGIIGSVGDNDFWRIVGGATASNAGYLEIATADDASEPIYVRQYGSGKFGTLTRSATLLDSSGNTSFPGTVSAAKGFNGNASSATKLQTARTINGTSFNGTANITTAKWGTARKINDVSVDGSADVAIPIKFWKSTVGDNNSKPYHRILTSNTVTGQWVDKVITVMASGNYDGGPFGIFRVTLRTNGTDSNSSIKIEWMVRKGFGLDSIVANFINKSGSTQADIFYKSAGSYNSITWTILGEGDRSSGNYNTSWTKINTAATTTEVYTEAEMKTLKSYTSTLLKGTDAAFVYASSTSDKLTTARTINGTSFNGTGNITTANWGTARTLTVGNTGKSVNGSGNISWSLSEIGALPTAGGTMTGNITFSEVTSTSYPANSSKITWNGSTDGADIYYRVTASDKGQLVLNLRDDADATIGIALNGAVKATFDTNGYYSGKANEANTLTTARTFTIGNTGQKFNGSGNVSWSLSEIGAASSSHTHNNIVSRGSVTAESGTTRPAVGGLSMTQAYNNGYPSNYGNVLSMKGQGDGELFIGWSGNSGEQAPVYVRSKRDTGDANWSEWAQIYTSSLTTKTVSNGTLTLGTEFHQYATISSNTTIKLPSTSSFTEIHLFFNWPANVSVTMPSGVKWQQGVMYGPGHVHEFVFTYVKNIGWLGGCVVYG